MESLTFELQRMFVARSRHISLAGCKVLMRIASRYDWVFFKEAAYHAAKTEVVALVEEKTRDVTTVELQRALDGKV